MQADEDAQEPRRQRRSSSLSGRKGGNHDAREPRDQSPERRIGDSHRAVAAAVALGAVLPEADPQPAGAKAKARAQGDARAPGLEAQPAGDAASADRGSNPAGAAAEAKSAGDAEGSSADTKPAASLGADAEPSGGGMGALVVVNPPLPAPLPTGRSPRNSLCYIYIVGRCKQGAACLNRHPNEAERQELLTKMQRMRCKLGVRCSRVGCIYTHPEGRKDPEA